MIYPIVLDILPCDFDSLSAFLATDHSGLSSGWFEVIVGIADEDDGGERFSVFVYANQTIARLKQEGHSLKGIAIEDFSPNKVVESIHQFVSSCKAFAWEQVREKLTEAMDWEYES